MRLLRFNFVVIVIVSIMISTVYLRSNSRRLFYECRSNSVEVNRLKRDLILKKLEAGSIVNSIVYEQTNQIDKPNK